jgi:hypothetical protein
MQMRGFFYDYSINKKGCRLRQPAFIMLGLAKLFMTVNRMMVFVMMPVMFNWSVLSKTHTGKCNHK